MILRKSKEVGRSLNWWSRVFIGPVAVRLSLFFAFVALALAAYSFGVLQNQVDKNAGRTREQERDRQAAIAANLRARYDDCQELNHLRVGPPAQGLRGIVVQSQQTLPLIKRVFPQLPPSYFAQAAVLYRQELALFTPDDCTAYARRALPRKR